MKNLGKVALISCLVSSSAVFATNNSVTKPTNKTTWYQIEMVIFSQFPYSENQNEQWPYIQPFQLPSTVYQLEPQAIYLINQQHHDLTSYPLLNVSQFNLNNEVMHISHNPNYNLIGHFGWSQPITQSASAPTSIEAANNETHMDGLITLTKQTYIQVKLSTIFATQIKAFKNKTYINSINNNGVVRFNLNRSFKMRLNELDYIDSPFYGILIKIIKLH